MLDYDIALSFILSILYLIVTQSNAIIINLGKTYHFK